MNKQSKPKENINQQNTTKNDVVVEQLVSENQNIFDLSWIDDLQHNVVIGLMGKKGSGKDTIAKLAISDYKAKNKIAVTDLLKNICSKCLNLNPALFNSAKDEHFIKPFNFTSKHVRDILDLLDILLTDEFKKQFNLTKIRFKGTQKYSPRVFFSPREILQFVGTNLIQSIYQDFLSIITYSQFCDKNGIHLITDLRFQHEAKLANSLFNYFYPVKIIGRKSKENGTEEHISEKDWEFIKPFYTINNNSDIKVLEENLKELYTKIHEDLKTKKPNLNKLNNSILSNEGLSFLGLLSPSEPPSKFIYGHKNDNFIVRGFDD